MPRDLYSCGDLSSGYMPKPGRARTMSIASWNVSSFAPANCGLNHAPASSRLTSASVKSFTSQCFAGPPRDPSAIVVDRFGKTSAAFVVRSSVSS